nr:putative ribonuclease H-like domain-containing protein [Tanacetum cinerariifolium]
MENKPNVAGSGPAWLFDIDSISLTMNYHPVLAKNQSNPTADAHTGRNEHNDDIQKSVSPSCGDQAKEQGDKAVNKDKGKSPVVTITGFRDLNEEFAECINNSSNRVSAAGPSVSAAGIEFTNSTNDFTTAGPSVSAAGIEFINSTNDFTTAGPSVSAAGIEFINSTNDFTTAGPSVSAAGIEFINSTNDFTTADDVGAEDDTNNMESVITVSPILTTRIHKDHPISQIIGDLSSTTQTRSMARGVRDQGGISQMFNEDFHTCMFACFLSQKKPKRIHQALKDPSWIEAMQEELLQFKMQKVWILVDLPYGKRAIGTKWVYRNKKDERGIVIRNKARLVAQGHT